MLKHKTLINVFVQNYLFVSRVYVYTASVWEVSTYTQHTNMYFSIYDFISILYFNTRLKTYM